MRGRKSNIGKECQAGLPGTPIPAEDILEYYEVMLPKNTMQNAVVVNPINSHALDAR